MDSGHIDGTAVARIRDERIDWRFKGMPDAMFGRTIDEVAGAGLDLFTDGFVGPLLVLDAQALEHNLSTMAQWAAEHGMALAPHGKTTMAPQLFARQLAHGAWAMTAANISQLRVYRAFGVSRVLLANELVDPAALRWLAAELDRDPNFEFSCWVDSVPGVRLMDEVLREVRPSRPVDVLVELGAPGGRAGVRDLPTGMTVGAVAADSPVLRLVGVGGYEGALAHDTAAHSLHIVDSYLSRLRELTIGLATDGHLDQAEQVIVTAGGSAYFDQVTTVLGAPWPSRLNVLPVLRSGAYVAHDDGFYQEISPFGRSAEGSALRPALRAWAQVTSRPQDDLALLTIGKRDASFDEGLPMPQLIRRSSGEIEPLIGCQVSKLSDQHAFLTTPEGDSGIEVGDWIGLGLSHPCTVFDKWQLIPVVGGPRDSTVVDLVRTYF